MESDAAFATNVNQGDFTPKNEFRVYSGATDFMGLGGGRDAYQNLKNVLPANPPILTNSIELGVDSNFALYDIQTARNATGGKAARMWPQTENGLKLALEKFPPLRIEWELSTLGGRSDDQVCHHQIPSLYFSSSNRHPPPPPRVFASGSPPSPALASLPSTSLIVSNRGRRSSNAALDTQPC